LACLEDPRVTTELNENFFVQLFEEIPEAMVLTDCVGNIIKANAEFSRMFGFSAEDATGRCIDDLVAPDEFRAEAMTITEAVAHGQKFILEAVRRRKDGTLVQVSLLGVPVIARNLEVAVFGIYRDITDRKKAEQSLQEGRRQMEEAYAQLELISNLDGLTAIPNRRYFERFYDLEWRRRCREGRPVSLIMIDIDFFKRYNDCSGHLAGDRCLKQVAQALHVVNRAGELVARYGGEEFVAVLSGLGLEEALHIAERMRQRVKELKIPHGHSPVADHVTISLGVATQVPEPKLDPMDLILRADQALYLAKSRGRDRVEVVDS
jgi:diguanylate cyclase (GGDEF)-like protein/PAS domain S-box-containing protein